MSRRKSTIYDLAKLAEVSPSTVSAVLSGNWRERRIAEATAQRVQALATHQMYSVNRQASGLRKSQSGLIGMIIPLHDNRFFSGMAQAFERCARERNWYPIVVSTLRDPALELETVSTLISYRVEHLLIVGATDPDSVSGVCRNHHVAHVNVDLPGTQAASVISDNYWGAQQLTESLIDRSAAQRAARRNKAYFVGGVASDYATRRRIEGFSDVVRERFGSLEPAQIDACGYEADLAEAAIRRLHRRLRRTAARAVRQFDDRARRRRALPEDACRPKSCERCAFGCYDWDPFASVLSFPLLMVRQNIEGLLDEAFRIIDRGPRRSRRVIEIKPELMFG